MITGAFITGEHILPCFPHPALPSSIQMGLLLCARAAAAAAAAAAPPAAQRPESPQQLPVELRDVTAVLSAPNPEAPQGRTLVYVLGMSHVSKRSLGHIEHLISLVSATHRRHLNGRFHCLAAPRREMSA